jgi:hypothetical protein
VEEPSALWKSLQRCGRAFSVVESLQCLKPAISASAYL